MRRATTLGILAGPRSASRATSRSSKASDLVPHHLDGLVALAGDHHDVARRGLGQGQRDGGGPVGLDDDRRRRPACPARMASMMASGSSLRGLSEVSTTRSARRAATSPISGRFERIAVAAGAEHDQHPPAGGGLARRLEGAGERARLVGVVDEHRERLALVDRLEPPGHGSARPQARPRSSPSGMPSCAAAVAAARALLTLNRPPSASSTSSPRHRNEQPVGARRRGRRRRRASSPRSGTRPGAAQLRAARVVEVHHRAHRCRPG